MRPERLLKAAGINAPPPEPMGGGDVARLWRAGPYVIKTHPAPPPGMFPAEAEGLQALREAGILTPDVLWAGEAGLVLTYLPPGKADWPGLAKMLARLHKTRRERYGWSKPVYLGTFPLSQGEHGAWDEFFVNFRLAPLLEATWNQLGPTGKDVERLLARYTPPAEGPTLIHGDLWHGNLLMSQQGPALIDPSVWVGERGVDLAMMRLFGGFPPTFWDHYEAIYPVPDEVRDALPYYQLYFLLVHVHFFGPAYLSGIQRVLRIYG